MILDFCVCLALFAFVLLSMIDGSTRTCNAAIRIGLQGQGQKIRQQSMITASAEGTNSK